MGRAVRRDNRPQLPAAARYAASARGTRARSRLYAGVCSRQQGGEAADSRGALEHCLPAPSYDLEQRSAAVSQRRSQRGARAPVAVPAVTRQLLGARPAASSPGAPRNPSRHSRHVGGVAEADDIAEQRGAVADHQVHGHHPQDS